MNTLDELLADVANAELPKHLSAYDKIKTPLKSGMRIGWYFKDDQKFWKKEKLNPRRQTQYSGIVVPAPDVETRGELQPEDCVVVMDNYPVEKENPEATWFALRRLLDNPELVEVFCQAESNV